jgi:hypothetical protein
LRRLFQTILATPARRKQEDARYDTCRRVEITIEREVVEVIHPLGRTPGGANPEPVEAEPDNSTSRTILEERQ